MKIQTAVLDLRVLPAFPHQLKASTNAMKQLDAFWWLRSMMGRSLKPSEVKTTALAPGLILISRLVVEVPSGADV